MNKRNPNLNIASAGPIADIADHTGLLKENDFSQPNEKLIGQSGSRNLLATPCLLVDEQVLQRNIEKMASLVRKANRVLRPHAKAHKCIEIAQLQLLAGANGISVATIGEAEVFFHGGVKDILLTSTFAPGIQIERILHLATLGCQLSLVVDHPDTVVALGKAAKRAHITLSIFVDIDMGRKRSGCVTPEAAVALADIIYNQQFLKLVGLQAYAGHLSHLVDFEERRLAAIDSQNLTKKFKQALAERAEQALVCTGGSTGSLMLDLLDSSLDELQYGSYVFMDVEYLAVDPDGSEKWAFDPSLFVKTTVISANAQGVVTADAGDKRFANKYGALPKITDPRWQRSVYRPVSDEHGQIELAPGEKAVVGDSFECVVPHCDPTANLFSYYHVVKDDRLVVIWSIDARGVF